MLSSCTGVCECGEEDRPNEDQEEVEVVGQILKADEALHPWRYAATAKGRGYLAEGK